MDKMMFNASSRRELMMRRGSVQRFIDTRCRIEDTPEVWRFFIENPQIGLAVAKNFEMGNIEKRRKFIRMMSEPKLNVIFSGSKGKGKTALAYWIAERLYEDYEKHTCILHPINFQPSLLPWYFYMAENQEGIDFGDFCIFDEAQIRISSRRSTSNINLDFSSFLTIQRHKGISMFVIQQDIEMADVNEYRLADGFIFKPSGMVQLKEKMTRGNVIMKFLQFLRPLTPTETLYISSDLNTILLFENPLPSFWTHQLSTPTKDITINDMREQMKKKPKK